MYTQFQESSHPNKMSLKLIERFAKDAQPENTWRFQNYFHVGLVFIDITIILPKACKL